MKSLVMVFWFFGLACIHTAITRKTFNRLNQYSTAKTELLGFEFFRTEDSSFSTCMDEISDMHGDAAQVMKQSLYGMKR